MKVVNSNKAGLRSQGLTKEELISLKTFQRKLRKMYWAFTLSSFKPMFAPKPWKKRPINEKNKIIYSEITHMVVQEPIFLGV